MAGEALRAFHYHDDELVAMILIGEDPLETELRPPGVDTLDLYECPDCSEQVSIGGSVVPTERRRDAH